MTTFSPNDYIIIGGDFNARTGVLPDYIHENPKYINFLNLPDSYNIDKFTKTRNNQDLHINLYGEKLIDFAISTKLRILNGRALGDLMGRFTYIGYNGVSVVDYTLASENFIMKNYTHSFSIEALTTLSDHRPLNLKLNYIQNYIQKPVSLSNKPVKFQIKNLETKKEMSTDNISSLISKLDKCNTEEDLVQVVLSTNEM